MTVDELTFNQICEAIDKYVDPHTNKTGYHALSENFILHNLSLHRTAAVYVGTFNDAAQLKEKTTNKQRNLVSRMREFNMIYGKKYKTRQMKSVLNDTVVSVILVTRTQ